jgi:hypothetical protein
MQPPKLPACTTFLTVLGRDLCTVASLAQPGECVGVCTMQLGGARCATFRSCSWLAISFLDCRAGADWLLLLL